jgi:glycosyltransferase involved in cell wall biosynthesis
MKLFYLTPFDVLRTTTNRISDVLSCEGFTQNKILVRLITPYIHRYRGNIKRENIFQSYGVKSKFSITIFFTFLWDSAPKLITGLTLFFYFSFYTVFIIIFNLRSLSSVIITSPTSLGLLPIIYLNQIFSFKNKPIVISWLHEIIFNDRSIMTYKNSDLLAVSNSKIKEDLIEKLGIDASKIIVVLNPVSSSLIENIISREDARKQLKIDNNIKLIAYTGKLYIDQKEVIDIISAAERLPDYKFLFTGGKPHVVKFFDNYCLSKNINNCIFTGFIKLYTEVIKYQLSANALVSYYSDHDHLLDYNLPQKICEYMLTKNPIITQDLPATKDLLNDNNTIFVESNNIDSLVKGIELAINHTDLAKQKSEQAFIDVQGLTYNNQAKNIISAIKKIHK